MYLNKALIIGNLTRDPELKNLPSGVSVASFGVATNHVYKDRDGNKQESAEFHNVVVFGKQAETTAQYLRKGSQCYIEGRLQTRSWDDKDTGKKLYRTEIVAERVQFGNKPRQDAPGSTSSYQAGQSTTSDPMNAPQTTTGDYPNEEINPDDIPW